MKPFERVMSEIYRHSLDNLGGTFSLEGALWQPEAGYIVSIDGIKLPSIVYYNLKYPAMVLADLFEKSLSYDREISGKLNLVSCIGYWIDEKDSLRHVYVDLNVWVESLEQAEYIGQLRKQLAIWDCNQNCEIRL